MADRLRRRAATRLSSLRDRASATSLVLVRAGADAAAVTSGEVLAREARQWGVPCETRTVPGGRAADVRSAVVEAGRDPTVAGVVLLRPLPRDLDDARLCRALAPAKDVGVDHPATRDAVLRGTSRLRPPLAGAVEALLDAAGWTPDGGTVAILGGAGFAVLALAAAMVRGGAALRWLPRGAAPHALDADVLVSDLGRPRTIDRSVARKGAIVVDLGVHVGPDGGLVGDADFEALDGWAGAVTRAPGAIGPPSSATVLVNLVAAAGGPTDDARPLPLFG